MTLIELLVVIAVLGILAAIVIFNVTGLTGRGSSAGCATDLESVQTSAQAFYYDHGNMWPSTLNDLVPQYLHTVPTDLGTVTFNADGHGLVTSSNCS